MIDAVVNTSQKDVPIKDPVKKRTAIKRPRSATSVNSDKKIGPGVRIYKRPDKITESSNCVMGIICTVSHPKSQNYLHILFSMLKRFFLYG